MLVIIAMLLIVLFGFLLVVILIPKMGFIERIGASFLLGLGIYTFLMFCYSTLGIRITFISTFLSLLILNILLLFLNRILKRKLNLGISDFINSFRQSPLIVKIAVILLGLIGLMSLLFTLYYPVYIWDALALYDFRAKVIAETGYFSQIANNYFYFSQYPLLTSLSHTIVYLFGGNNPQFIYSLLYISFLFVFYGALREFASRKVSLLTTILLSSAPELFEHSTFAYTNLPYVIYITLGTIYMFIWIVKQKPVGYLILAGLLTGLSTWSRSSEPFWAVNLLIIFAYSLFKYRKHILSPIWYCLSFFPIKWIWLKVYYSVMGTSNSTMSFVASELMGMKNSLFQYGFNFKRMIEVTIFIYEKVVLTWYPLLLVFILFLLLNVLAIKSVKKQVIIFLVFLAINFGLLIYGTYVYSLSFPYWEAIPDSARRMAMFFIPLMIFYIGLLSNNFIANKKG